MSFPTTSVPLREVALQLLLTRFVSRIVEYATREQAQNAVNTLSNQNLMGRLVYVREVSKKANPFTNGYPWVLICSRTGRRNPDSSVPPAAVVALEEVCKVAIPAVLVALVVEGLVARSTLPTFVRPLP